MPSNPSSPPVPSSEAAPLKAMMGLAFLASLNTGLFWLGVAFVSKHSFHFSETRSEVLYILMGAFNSGFAFLAGAISRRVGLPPRTQVRALLLALCAVGALPFAIRAEWALWVAGVGSSFVAALFWPLYQSYLTGGRTPAEARRAVGHFNVAWMASVAIAVIGLGALLEHWGLGVFVVLTVLVLPALPLARYLPPRPGRDEHSDDGAAPLSYRPLLRANRVFLPASYLLIAAMSPLLPYRLEALGLGLSWATAATGTWLVARVAAVYVMRNSEAWHGRWFTVVLGAAFLFGGVTAVLLAPSVSGLVAGFVVFGLGVGIVYHQALYYALRVGSSEVDAGGVHEGLIGLGYTLGPALALVCSLTAGPKALVASLGVVVAAGLVWTAKLAWSNRALPGPATPQG